jgi:hypothetical protein
MSQESLSKSDYCHLGTIARHNLTADIQAAQRAIQRGVGAAKRAFLQRKIEQWKKNLLS